MIRILAATAIVAVLTLPASAREVLPFVEDDYAKAVARAQTKKLPIFVEAWAPW